MNDVRSCLSQSNRYLLWAVVLVLGCAAVAAPKAEAQTFRVFSRLFDEYEASPGSQHRGQIVVVNEGKRELTLAISKRDYRFYADGTVLNEEPGTHERSNAHWITTEQDRLTLAPGERQAFFYSVSVPAGVTEGSYWGLLVVENVNDAAQTLAAGGSGRVRAALRQKVKVYVQVATHVGQPQPAIAFLSTDVVEDREGGRHLDVRIENTGDRSDLVPLWVELYDAAGQLATRLQAKSRVLHPGTSVRQLLDLSEVPPGDYDAIVVAEPPSGDAYAARLDLSL